MKLKQFALVLVALVVAVLVVLVVSASRKKSPSSRYGRQEPIKGSPSDPPVAFQSAWSGLNRYLFHLDTLASSDEPRRNAGDMISREVNFGLDFGLTVTNAAPDGSRVLEMDIQAVQFGTAVDDRVTVSFDSGYENLDMESSPIVGRLQRLIGNRVTFQISPENKVRRVFGLKEITDRLNERQTNSNRSVVRGLTGTLLNQFFTQNFWKDLLEVGALPTNEVRVGDSWTVIRDTSSGPSGGRATAELVYTFKGWQEHLKHRCARLEFTGTLKPGSRTRDRILRNLSGTNAPSGPNAPNAPNAPVTPPDGEPGMINGVTWFSPDLGVPVETVFDQTTTSKIVNSRRVAVVRGTNPPSGPNVAITATNVMNFATNASQTSYEVTRHQHVNLRLVELTPGSAPSAGQP